MSDFKDFLIKLHKNLNILREREAKYAAAAPLELLNQIDDYEQAITLAEQAIAQDVPLDQLQAEFSGLNLRLDMVVFVAQEPPRQPFTGRNPYQGLRKFTETEAEFFFGRTEDIQTLVAQVAGLMEKPTSPAVPELLAILGASGSGKSSLVRAGLIPALRAGQVAGSEQWPIKVILPGPRPLEALAEVFLDKIERGMTAILAELAQGEKAFHHLIVEATQGQPDEVRFILVIDQFEELFTLGENESERQTFLDQLLYACQIPRNRAFIILTMRADFYAKASVYKNLAQAITKNQMLVSPLTERELREAILLPAEAVGLELEKDLVQALVHDTMEAPGALPLLQHALDELFRRRDGNLLRMQSYQEIGGIRGGVAHRADGVMEQLNLEQQQMARRIFLRLIQPGEGTMDTRRRATFEEMLTQTISTQEVEIVVQTLADANLLITNRNPETNQVVLDVAHEALIQEWPTLRRWVREGRQGLRIRQQLSQATRDWADRGQDEGSLYRGARLLEVEEWVAVNPGEINPHEQAFLEASIAFREREVAEKEAQRQRELEAAQKLAAEAEARRQAETKRAEEQAQASKRLRQQATWLAGVGLAAVLLALAAGLFGVQSRQSAHAEATARAVAVTSEAEAKGQASLALSRQLAAQSLTQERLDLALLLSLQAAQTITETLETRSSLLTNLQRQPLPLTFLTGHTSNVSSVAFSSDGTRLASGSQDQTIILWDVSDPTRPTQLGEPLTGHTGRVISVAFNPECDSPLEGCGTELASLGADDTIRLWDVSDPAQPGQLSQIPTDPMSSMAFSPDGTRLASGSDDGAIMLWDVSDPTRPTQLGEPLTGHTGLVTSLAFNPECDSPPEGCGTLLASGSEDQTIILWDVSEPTRPTQLGEPLTGHTNWVDSLAFSPAGTRLASGSDGAIILWDVSDPAQPDPLGEPVIAHTGQVLSLAFNPDTPTGPGGTWLASAGSDNIICLWNVSDSDQPIQFSQLLTAHTGPVFSVAFSPDGTRLASGGVDQAIILWDVRNPTRPTQLGQSLAGHPGPVFSLAFSPNGTLLASGSTDPIIFLWDAHDPTQPILLRELPTGHEDYVYSLAFSPECDSPPEGCGTRLAYGSDDGAIRLWDVSNPAQPSPPGPLLTGHKGNVFSLAFSPDGKLLASGSEDKDIRLWDVSDPAQPRLLGKPLAGHTKRVWSVAFSPNGKWLASGSADGYIRLWDVSDPTRPSQLGQPLTTGTSGVGSVAFSPECDSPPEGCGRQLASGDFDQTILLWDVSDPTRPIPPSQRLTGHTKLVNSVAFSPDGKWLASGDAEGVIRLWDMSNPARPASLGSLTGHLGSVTRVAFGPDGSWLASSSWDGTIILWEVNETAWQQRACRIANRNLTRAEWDQFIGSAKPYQPTCPNLPAEN